MAGKTPLNVKVVLAVRKIKASIGNLIRIIYYRKTNSIIQVIKGRNNTIGYKNTILSGVVFDIEGDENRIEIEKGCILNNIKFYIRGSNHRVLIKSGCRFNGGSIWFEDSHCLLTIGNNTTFEYVHLALTEPNRRITIGDDCMFAYDIDVRTGDSHSIISKETDERINYAEDVTIGNHVWIAAHCILLKGSVISDNSVVATGSVVTGKFSTKGVILGGNPAKQLKDGISWLRERI